MCSSDLDSDEPTSAYWAVDNVSADTTVVRYLQTSLTRPNQTWEIDLATGARTLLKAVQVPGDFDADRYATRRIDIIARDGAFFTLSVDDGVQPPIVGSTLDDGMGSRTNRSGTVDIKDGLSLLRRIPGGPDQRANGRRVRIQCEGAEYRGRGRLVTWNVSARVENAAIVKVVPVNFWNPDIAVVVEDHSVAWENITTGGFHAVDVWLDDATQATLHLSVNGEDIRLDLAGLGTDDNVRDFGGLGKAVRLTRLPDDPQIGRAHV